MLYKTNISRSFWRRSQGEKKTQKLPHIELLPQGSKQRAKIHESRRNETNEQQPHNGTKNLQGPQLFNGAIASRLTKYSKRYSNLLCGGFLYIPQPQLTKQWRPKKPSKNSKRRHIFFYTWWPGKRPISLHCSGSKEEITCSLRGKSSPSMPQPLWVCFPGLIFTDFTCIQMETWVISYQSKLMYC